MAVTVLLPPALASANAALPLPMVTLSPVTFAGNGFRGGLQRVGGSAVIVLVRTAYAAERDRFGDDGLHARGISDV